MAVNPPTPHCCTAVPSFPRSLVEEDIAEITVVCSALFLSHNQSAAEENIRTTYLLLFSLIVHFNTISIEIELKYAANMLNDQYTQENNLFFYLMKEF